MLMLLKYPEGDFEFVFGVVKITWEITNALVPVLPFSTSCRKQQRCVDMSLQQHATTNMVEFWDKV